MKQLFAVILKRGPAWQASRAMEQQEEWHSCLLHERTRKGTIYLTRRTVGGDRRSSSCNPRDDPGGDRRSAFDRSMVQARSSSCQPNYAVDTAIRFVVVSSNNGGQASNLSRPARISSVTGQTRCGEPVDFFGIFFRLEACAPSQARCLTSDSSYNRAAAG